MSEVTMTAVKGHLTAVDFGSDYKSWEWPPPERLFDAPVDTLVPSVSHLVTGQTLGPRVLNGRQDRKNIAQNIEEKARHADALVIWTDCDREGEHIGGEIRDAAKRGNRRIDVKRARFSNIERA